MTPEQFAAWKRHRSNLEHARINQGENKYKRRAQRLDRQIKNIRAVVGHTKRTYQNQTLMPIMPFRLWLLRQIVQGETVASIAKASHKDEEEIRRYTTGIYWDGPCDPQPIHTVTLGIIDDVLTAMGQGPDVLDELYPYMED